MVTYTYSKLVLILLGLLSITLSCEKKATKKQSNIDVEGNSCTGDVRIPDLFDLYKIEDVLSFVGDSSTYSIRYDKEKRKYTVSAERSEHHFEIFRNEKGFINIVSNYHSGSYTKTKTDEWHCKAVATVYGDGQIQVFRTSWSAYDDKVDTLSGALDLYTRNRIDTYKVLVDELKYDKHLNYFKRKKNLKKHAFKAVEIVQSENFENFKWRLKYLNRMVDEFQSGGDSEWITQSFNKINAFWMIPSCYKKGAINSMGQYLFLSLIFKPEEFFLVY